MEDDRTAPAALLSPDASAGLHDSSGSGDTTIDADTTSESVSDIDDLHWKRQPRPQVTEDAPAPPKQAATEAPEDAVIFVVAGATDEAAAVTEEADADTTEEAAAAERTAHVEGGVVEEAFVFDIPRNWNPRHIRSNMSESVQLNKMHNKCGVHSEMSVDLDAGMCELKIIGMPP